MIAVIGGTGVLGSTVVRALIALSLPVTLVAPDPAKANRLFADVLPRLTIVRGSVASPKELRRSLVGVSTVFVNAPGSPDCGQRVICACAAGKVAGAAHLVVVSNIYADSVGSPYGRRFFKLEAGVKSLDIPTTFLRLPAFFENVLASVASVVEEGVIYSPVPADTPVRGVAVEDVGAAAAAVLAAPDVHAYRTYEILSRVHTGEALAASLGEAVGKPVRYVQIGWEESYNRMVAEGTPAWEAADLVEADRLVAAGNVSESNHYEELVEEAAMTIQEWTTQNAFEFE